MKKFLLFPLLILMTAVIIPSCSDDDKNIVDDGKDTISNGKDTISTNYMGTLIVNEDFHKDSTITSVTIAENSLTLDIHKVKFAENMPVEINITVPEIPYNKDRSAFIGDSIVPLMGTISVPDYTFTKIEGTINDTVLTFSSTIKGRGTFTYSGKIVSE